MPESPENARTAHVCALLDERRGYEAAGKADRIAQVDAELAKFDAAPVKRTAPKKAKAADE